MTVGRLIELVLAALILGAGIWFYVRGDRSSGSQGAVLLFAVAAIMGIHALGGLDYRPTATEIELAHDR